MSQHTLFTLQPVPGYGNVRYYVDHVAAWLGFDRLKQLRLGAAAMEVGGQIPAESEAVTVTLDISDDPVAAFLIKMTVNDAGAAAALSDRGVAGASMFPGERARHFLDRLAVTIPAPGQALIILETQLPATIPAPGEAELEALRQNVRALPAVSSSSLVQQQNRALLDTLELLQERQEELSRLNLELEDTNRGVLALYSEMDERVAARTEALAEANVKLEREIQVRRRAEQQLRKLSQQLVAAQEEERQRLAQALHDEAGQALTALKLNLSLLEGDVPDQLEMLRQGLEEAIELADQTMEQLRLTAHALRPPSLDKLGLNAALEGLCRDFGTRTGLAIAYHGEPVPSLQGELQISLYRFVQEALANIGKHAAAREVTVIFAHTGEEIVLSVADDGRGFDLEQVSRNEEMSGIGLVGMRERLDLLGGDLEIRTRPGKGTYLRAIVPYVRGEG